MATISLSGRTWVGNDKLNTNIWDSDIFYFTETLDFECDGVSYTAMDLGYYFSAYSVRYKKSDGTAVIAAAKDGTWKGTKYKSLTFPEGGNGHTSFRVIWFLFQNGTFTPDIEELKTPQMVDLSFVVTSVDNYKNPRAIISPYSKDTNELLGGGYMFDFLPSTAGTHTYQIPFYKDIIYSYRVQNVALSYNCVVNLNGQKIEGFSGADAAIANCYSVLGGDTITIIQQKDGTDTTIRWGFGLEVETPKTAITYNGTETTLEAGQTATLACQGKKTTGNIVVAFGGAGSITYDGSATEVEAGKTATLQCAGKKMTSDVYITMSQ